MIVSFLFLLLLLQRDGKKASWWDHGHQTAEAVVSGIKSVVQALGQRVRRSVHARMRACEGLRATVGAKASYVCARGGGERVYVCVPVCVCVCVYVRARVCICVSVYLCVCVCYIVCVHVCVSV